MVKGPLSGFMIVDPAWDSSYIESLIASTTQEIKPSSTLVEEDENFIVIEKE